MNVKVVNLISGVNETRFLVQHQSCYCKSRLKKVYVRIKENWRM